MSLAPKNSPPKVPPPPTVKVDLSGMYDGVYHHVENGSSKGGIKSKGRKTGRLLWKPHSFALVSHNGCLLAFFFHDRVYPFPLRASGPPSGHGTLLHQHVLGGQKHW